MGRRKSRSVSPSSMAKAKKSKSSSVSSSFPTNPLSEISEYEYDYALLEIHTQDGSSVVLDEENGSNCDEAEPIFQDLLQFIELTNTRKKVPNKERIDEAEANIEQEDHKILIRKTVRSLLTHMRSESHRGSAGSSDEHGVSMVKAKKFNAFLSAEEIAYLLLPWSVKGILKKAYKYESSSSPPSHVASPLSGSSEILHWKTLNDCLSFFFNNLKQQEHRRTIRSMSLSRNHNLNMLTLSTLHKLVPIALKSSLNENNNSDKDGDDDDFSTETLQEMASYCFCQLVDQIYRPPFDAVCDTLLPIMTRDHEITSGSQITTIWLTNAESLLKLMKSTVTSANPKKSFQLLVRPKTILDLSIVYRNVSNSTELHETSRKEHLQRIEGLFKDLIRAGIFSLEHHMDGFRSLQLPIPIFGKEKAIPHMNPDAKSSFRVYQEGLLSTLEKILIPCEKDNHVVIFSWRDAASVSCILPLFLSIFIGQVSKMQEQQQATSKSPKKGKSKEKLGHLQFRFFSRISGFLLNGLMMVKEGRFKTQMQEEGLRVSFLAVLGKNLDILMTHNVYQPSLRNDMERSFLEEIGNHAVKSAAGYRTDSGMNISLPEWKKSLTILDVLIQLNHKLLHDQLPEILARCLTFDACSDSHSDTSGICNEAFSFFISVITTYGRLRQLDHFYRCLFDAVKALSFENSSQRIVQYLDFADDRRISNHLGRVIQGCPIHQLKQIFSSVNNFIVSQWWSDEKELSIEVKSVAITVITNFLVGLLRDVRVDSNSFNDIYYVCKDIMNGSVMSLIESDRDYNNAVLICAWTIHLKNRCEFWIGKKSTESSSEEKLEIPSALQQLLKSANNPSGVFVAGNEAQSFDFIESLKFLACQRIQQLHGQCYEKQRLAYATDARQYSTAFEIAEARKLVGFILQNRNLTELEAKSKSIMSGQWEVLVECITIWAPYADESDIDTFLNQLIQALSKLDKYGECKSDVLKSILNDASFYEISNVSERLGANIASFVAEMIQKAVSLCEGSSSVQFEMACPMLLAIWRSFSVEEMTNVYQGAILRTCNSSDLPQIYQVLRESLRVLEITNDIGVSIWKECKDASKILQSIIRIELICNILFVSDERSFLDIKVRLISALRITASRVLASLPVNPGGKFLETQELNYMTLLPHILKNSFKIIDLDSASSTIDRCIHSCATLTGALVNAYIALDFKAALYMIKVLDSTFDQEEVARGDFQYFILTNYAIVLLRKFRGFFGTDSDNAAVMELSRVLKKRLWKKSYEYCFNGPKDALFVFQNQSIFFIAEALRLCSASSDAQVVPLSSVEKNIASKLRDLSTHDPKEVEVRCISYLVGCLAAAKPSKTVRHELADELLLAILNRHEVFLTPLCILARGMEKIEFDKFLNRLTSNVVQLTSTVTKLRIVHMIVLSACNQDQINLLSKYSEVFLDNCLQVMSQVATRIDLNCDSMVEVSSLIVDMTTKKGIMTLREKDISLILARMTSTINVDEHSGDRIFADVQLSAYDACFALLSLFLQRFSKQVHNCVPLLVISLTTMLQFALSKFLPLNSVPCCGQKFSRLCELLLPHAGVYKKHVVCLLLRFVNSLRDGIHPECKKSLLPGVYCLLDIIEDHETKQLNSMMDEECRALLRSIHEGYKKIHVYKGQ